MARISKEEFEKALLALEEAYSECSQQPLNSKAYKLLRDAAIQRFEFSIEIAWKVATKSLGGSSTSPKPALREMLKSGLIVDIDQWFDFIEARNKSSDSYDEAIATEDFSQLATFISAARDLLSKI